MTLFDTADVYGDGRSEQLIGRFLAEHPRNRVVVATKMGRRAEQVPENYVLANFRAWTDRSRANLGVDTLDLVQLHCPPSAVFASDEVFDALDTLRSEQAIRTYGVSVETADQALTAIARPGVADRADHPERVPAQAAGAGAARARPPPASASSRASRSRPGCSRVATPATRPSPRTTTATTTATARRSTSARRSPASTTRPGSRPRRSSPPSCPTESPPRSSRCAG